MHRESFDWLKPSPLWEAGLASARQPDFFQPQLLQFNDDNFIGAFRKALAANDPDKLRAALVPAGAQGSAPKLFQPAHGCFYLVTATLSCRVPGLPERTVRFADHESAFFVLRKFVAGVEYAWVVDGTDKRWQPMTGRTRTVAPMEERLPLFRVVGADGRAVFVGYVPVASQDAYLVKAQDLNAAMDADERGRFPNGIDLRIEDLQARFRTPLTRPVVSQPPTSALEQARDASPSQSLTVSVYLLLDLWQFFEEWLPDVAAALLAQTAGAFSGDGAAAKSSLMALLATPLASNGFNLAHVLGKVAAQRDALEAAGGADPAALGLGDCDFAPLYSLLAQPVAVLTGTADALEAAVLAALPPDTSTVMLPVSTAAGESYALRCVYERPRCTPARQVLSQPSMPFQLAPFFDADAPARPVRIVLPTDVSLAGLRKFNRGVTFLISGSLQKKIAMVTGAEKQLLKDPASLNPEGLELGWMCSFSIQIIFIVAFFLLLMFVIILNFVFWWIAFFKICIPIPKGLAPK